VGILASTRVWNSAVRISLFWLLVALALLVLGGYTPYSNWQLVFTVFEDIRRGDIDRIADQNFAFALSSGIVQIAFALAFAFLLAHVLFLRAAVFAAKRDLGPSDDPQNFAARFDIVTQRLERNAIVGHAWRQFEATLVRKDAVVRNTVRPQAFINLAHARERLFGLKMMASIPGFFVGLGLFLTFVGLVLALNKAAGSTSSGSAEMMTKSLNDLLSAATFKFSTSIAGLGASLLLSFLFRTYQIWIEGAFESFGRAVEDRMQFQPPQRTAVDSLDLLIAQRDQLKEINSEAFFGRLGETIAPRIQTALADAMSPISNEARPQTDEVYRLARVV
jgi:hypothetical protein